MDIEIDVRSVENLMYQISEKSLKIANKRAMNKTAITMRKIVNDKIGKNLPGIKKTQSKKSISLIKPNTNVFSSMTGGLKISPLTAPLSHFKGRQNKTGYTATIKKKIKIKGAFQADMKNGGHGVFIRESSARLPIKKIFSTSAFDVIKDEAEKDYFQKIAEGIFMKYFSRELEYEIKKIHGQIKRVA